MPGRLVWRQPARHGQMDRVGRAHRAAALGLRAGRVQAWPQKSDAARPAARPYRHGGERPRPRARLDTVDRLAEGTLMTAQERAWRWGVPAIWAAILIVSCVTQTYVAVADDARRG